MINYPNKKTNNLKQVNQGNRGMTLESDLAETNKYYLDMNIAVIHKKPTPIQVVDVSYPARNKAKIVEAYYKTPSTTDFNGIYRGKYIDFDAKETTMKTAMPLKNIHSHQIEHLRAVQKQGGIAFLIVHFKAFSEYYLLPSEVLLNFWDTRNNDDGRKSIPYQVFKEKAHPIQFNYLPRLDYLKVVDKYYFE